MHILHVVPGLGPGGMELAMARVIRGLAERGYRHSIICIKGEAEIADRLGEDVPIFRMHSPPNEPWLPLRMARIIKRVRPDVVHSRNWGAWPEMAVGRLLCPPVVPFIYSFHGLGRAGYMPRRRVAASSLLVRATTRLGTVSEASRRMLHRHWRWPLKKVWVLPNGVDTARFHPPDTRDGAEDRPLRIGTVGNLRPVKNHSLLIRACAELHRQGVPLEVRIAGEGELRDDLTRQAEAEGFGDRLRLVGRIQDVPGFLGDLDIFVLSSDSEQHPNALNEAMACGLPCVSTRAGCAAELLDEGRCGILVPLGDRARMVDGIRRLAQDAALREHHGRAARQRVLEKYSLERMIDNYDALYASMPVRRRPRT